MSNYIDAEVLKEQVDDIWDNRAISRLGCRILTMIDKSPCIDIVFCKECKCSKWCRYNGEFYLWCNLNIKRVKESGYCSDGERKESE